MTDLVNVHDTAELRKLIAENPNLPIVVLVGQEAASWEYAWTYCTKVYCGLDEILDCEIPFGGGIIPTDKDDFEEQLADYLCDLPENKGLSDSEFDKLLKEEMAKYEPYWKKVISISANN
ncbi:MAG: hypothetical protein OSJ43_11665 [Oscillospiraceae bacterium]|nr:hypothetical protein [Oscillospiraceae bacterium]